MPIPAGCAPSTSVTGAIITLLTHQPTGNEWPCAIVRDGNSKLYVADQGVNTIFQIDALTPTTATAYAGNGNDIVGGWNNASGTGAQFLYPCDLAISTLGDLLVADYGNDEIRRVSTPRILRPCPRTSGPTPSQVCATGS